MAEQNHTWRIIPTGGKFCPVKEYGLENKHFISLKFIHGGSFSPLPSRWYNDPRVTFVDFVDVHTFSNQTFQEILQEIGYEERGFFYWKHPKEGINYGLCRLVSPTDFHELFFYLYTSNFSEVVQIFCETSEPTFHEFDPTYLLSATPKHISKLLFKFVYQFDGCTAEDCKNFFLGEYGVTFGDDLVKSAFWLALRGVREMKDGFKYCK